jgi:hypothetical protein
MTSDVNVFVSLPHHDARVVHGDGVVRDRSLERLEDQLTASLMEHVFWALFTNSVKRLAGLPDSTRYREASRLYEEMIRVMQAHDNANA